MTSALGAALPRLRRLPLVDRPFTGETLPSFLGRLATLNHLSHDELVFCLTGRDKLDRTDFRMITSVARDRLAVLTGYTARQLAQTFPTADEAHRFEQPWVTRWPALAVTIRDAESHVPACVLCSARRKPPGAIVRHWPAPSQRVCLRHHRWIGPPGRTITTGQVDLRVAHEIVGAAHRHQRLLRRHGPETNDAVALAEQFVRSTARRRFIRGRIDERIAALCGERSYFEQEDLWHAATYPEAVALAALLVNQRWTPDLLDGPQSGAFEEFDDLVHQDLDSPGPVAPPLDWMRHRIVVAPKATR